MPLTFGSLFAGIGGFDLGFERAGMECRWQVEIDPYCQRVLAKHWPNVRRHDDIETFPPAGEWGVDVICGGFPCQDISYAGAGAGLGGKRSGLFYKAIRVVQELQPKIVVLENVAALLTRGLDQVLGTLAEVGYDAEWHCIPAAAVGAPHIRDRLFIIAYVADADDSGRRASESKVDKVWEATQDTEQQKPQPELSRFGSPRIATWWATEPNVGRVADGIPARVDRLRGLGNAVVPHIAQFIGEMIVANTKGA